MIAQTDRVKVGGEKEAARWLKEHGYTHVNGAWMKGRSHAAIVELLATGKASIVVGVRS